MQAIFSAYVRDRVHLKLRSDSKSRSNDIKRSNRYIGADYNQCCIISFDFAAEFVEICIKGDWTLDWTLEDM